MSCSNHTQATVEADLPRYMPIPRPLFETDFLLHVYKLDEPVDAHKLACVFLVMALGVMFDLTGPPCTSACPSDNASKPSRG